MGKTNQQRRAAKRKARAERGPTPPRPSGHVHAEHPADLPSFEVSREDQARSLVIAGARSVGNPAALEDAIQELVVFGGTVPRADALVASREATVLLNEQLATLYTYGWQPADVLHVVRRERSVRIGRLAAAVIAEHGLAQGAPTRAPLEWLRQLESIAGRPLGDVATPGWNVLQHAGFSGALWDSWSDILTLVAHWSAVIPMEKLLPPPSSWPKRRVAVSVGASVTVAHDPKKLATIRALLAKAEATEFAEEAEAFTAKAQDLMTRYAIDEALLIDTTAGYEIRSRRLHVDNPYASTKAQLLATVGRVNRVKAIWNDQFGIVTIVGLPVDLDLSEMLFTSLLVQATKAMTEVGSASEGGHRLDRAPSFRRAFLLAYAQRIGERLTEVEEHAQQEESVSRGTDLLPVLARQTAAVEQEFERLFPHTTQSKASRVDARGWHAGRAAADRAVLAKGQVGR